MGILFGDGIVHIGFPGQELSQIRNFFVILLCDKRRTTGLLVTPVRGHPKFSQTMHFLCSDLHFERLSIFRNDNRMQRLIAVRLRSGNIVIELFQDRCPETVDDIQYSKTGLDIGNDDPESPQIIHLGKIERLATHLVVDAVNMFRSTGHLRLDACRIELLFQAGHDPADEILALCPFFLKTLCDFAIGIRIDEPERKVFQLPLHLPDTQTVRQRCVNFERFLGIMPADIAVILFPGQITQRRHSRSQPDHDDTHIGSHGQQHLAQRLGLRLPYLGRIFSMSDFFKSARQIPQFEKFADTVDQIGYFHSETGFYLFCHIRIVFRQNRQQTGNTRLCVAVQFRKDQTDAFRKFNSRLTAIQIDIGIGLPCKCIGIHDKPAVVTGKTSRQILDCISYQY